MSQQKEDGHKIYLEKLKNIFLPACSVAATILVLYFLKLLPPLPLSIQHLSVYHNVTKQGENYILSYDRPWYKFWRTNSVDFKATPEDKIFVYARIFSPVRFDDQIVFHWQYKSAGQWVTTDKISTRIRGGRSEGFRAFTTKSNTAEGDWRIRVETPDGRELGRVYFNLTKIAVRNQPLREKID